MQSAEGGIIEVEEYRNKSGLSFMCLHWKGNRGFLFVGWGAVCLSVLKAEMVQWP